MLAEQIKQGMAALGAGGAQIGVLLALALAAWIGWKFWNRQLLLNTLRTARIQPEALRALLDEGERPIVFDLRNADQIESDGTRIPGAQILGLDELDTRHEEIPRDREIILYCT